MMRSAMAFLPDSMMTFMNLDRSTEPNFGSGRISRLGTSRRRGISIPLSASAGDRAVCSADLAGGTHRRGHATDPSLTRRRSCAHRNNHDASLAADGDNRLKDPNPSLSIRQKAIKPSRARKPSGLLRPLRAVLRPRLLAILDALQVERTAHDVVANAGQVFDPAATHQHHAVLLQVVAFATDVGDDLEAVRQANLGDLPQGGVGLLRRGGVHAGAHATALRAVLHRRRLALDDFDLTALAHELVDGWHR